MSPLDDDYGAESHAIMLLPGWRHPHTGKVHIRRDCRAVEFHRGRMTPIIVRLDCESEVESILAKENLCAYCFQGF